MCEWAGAAGNRKYRPHKASAADKTASAHATAMARLLDERDAQQTGLITKLFAQQTKRQSELDKQRAEREEHNREFEREERAKDRAAQIEMLRMLLPALAGQGS